MDNKFFTFRDSEIGFFVILVAALSVLFIVSFIFGSGGQRKDISVPTGVASRQFPRVSLSAKSAYVYDVRTKTILFAKNENVRLPLASLTKVMSALVALDLSPLSGTITVTNEALKAEGNSGLHKDEKWSLRNLLNFSLVTSSNDAMRAVALSLGALSNAGESPEESINDFVRVMNSKARELGLKNTYFLNETGLDESEVKGGGYSTARDMSMLFEYILIHHPELFVATNKETAVIQSLDNRQHVAENTNSIVALIPGLVASKTGLTNLAGGNIAFVFDPELGRPIIVSILGSTEEGRFSDARTLVGAVIEYIHNN